MIETHLSRLCFTLLVMVMILLSCIPVSFSNGTDSDNSDSLKTSAHYKNRNTFLPAIGSTPETGVLFGGVVMRQFKPVNSNEQTRSSVVTGSVIYTLKKQAMIGFVPIIFLNDEKWIIEGSYEYSYCPDSFWGIGSRVSDSDELIYKYRHWGIVQSVQKKIGADMFIGPVIKWSKTTIIEYRDLESNLVERPRVPDSDGGITAGFGLLFKWDARNSLLNPTRNHLLSITVSTSPAFAGTTHPYSMGMVDARRYFDFKTNGTSVLAMQVLAMVTSGSPSFMNMPAIGGGNILRGYYYGRYRDKNSTQMQAEFRQHLYGRFGFTLFAATGEVWSDFASFTLSNPKYAGGIGIRFNINKEDTTNLRLDYGVGKGVSGVYLTFGEAF
jgi:outer membrane protein assembly factor BamA